MDFLLIYNKIKEIEIANTIPISGAQNIKAAIFNITKLCIAPNPQAVIAAPAKPPINVCEDEEGIPKRQVSKFQIIEAITPDKIIGKLIYCSITVLETVLAIPNSPIKCLAIKNATKLKKAAHKTA